MNNRVIEFDFSKLKGRIIEKFGSMSNFAIAARIDRGTLCRRFKNKSVWPSDDILCVCEPELLNIAREEIPIYFFAPKF